MERRRLTLHSASALPAEDFPALSPRLPLPGRCVSVVDTERGQGAAMWALSLVSALSALGQRVPVVLSAFGQAPELSGASQQAFRAVASELRLVSVPAPPEAVPFAELANVSEGLALDGPCWFFVGLPAALTYRASLSMLVLGERGPERWPRALRQLRTSFTVQVPAESNPGLAAALARAFLTTSPALGA